MRRRLATVLALAALAPIAALAADGDLVKIFGKTKTIAKGGAVFEVRDASRGTYGVSAAPETEVIVGKPARVIADVARAQGTDLIVMGTHGRTGFAHLMLGSVAERVVRIAPCAVLTVPEASRTADQVAIEATHAREKQPA